MTKMTERRAARDAARAPGQRRLVAVLDDIVDVLVDLGVPERIVQQACDLSTAVGGLKNFRGLDAARAGALSSAARRAGEAT
jgi:hypothetical protein